MLLEPVRTALASIHSTIDSSLSRRNYRPGNWVPHCSLATSISFDRKNDTLAIVEQSVDPFEVTFDAVDCASFMPVQVLKETAFLTWL